MIKINTEHVRLGKLEIELCKYELRPNTEIMQTCNTIYLHGTIKHKDVDALLEHHLSEGYAGIGYHFAIAQNGMIYHTRPLNIQGAHTYGRNKNSVGVVVFEIDKTTVSNESIISFKNLKTELENLYNKNLPVLSHTHAQFDYLNDQLSRYNKGLSEDNHFRLPKFDNNTPLKDEYAKQKNALATQITIQRNKGIPQEKRREFINIVNLSNALKLCPLKHYEIFKEAI